MHILVVCLLLASLIFQETTASPLLNPNDRIIGGDLAPLGLYRYVAAIDVQTSNSKFFCGGTVIHLQFILTSGHCVYNGVLFTIQLGAVNLAEENPNKVTVATGLYYAHPDFDPDSIQNDIALIKLHMPITNTMYIRTVSLPNHDITMTTSLLVLGFGHRSDSEAVLSDDLIYAVLSSISNEECRMMYGSQITDEMLCAIGRYNQGTCIGDTGGPLVWTSSKLNMVVGISSFVSANGCESVYPSGFTRVFPFVDWINSLIDAEE